MSQNVMDLTEFELASNPRGPRCGVSTAMDRLDAAGGAKLQEALSRTKNTPKYRRIKNTEIAVWLKARGIDMSHTTIGRHRRGDCSCDRSE